jgi:glycerol kinase
LVRAVLEGVAHRGADLLEAAEADSGLPIGPLRVDGGMSANPVFVQALADACGRPIEIAPVLEATTLGAAYLAGMAVGTWSDEEDVAAAWTPRQVVDPLIGDAERAGRRERWLRARSRSEATIPELSALDF